jgi:4,5-DOPA dioxygenase extradiol
MPAVDILEAEPSSPVTQVIPPIFVSHGSPMLAIQPAPARDFLLGLGSQMPRPRAVLAVSAHWETARPAIGAAPAPVTIHDFGGFDPALFQINYPAPGAPALAEEVHGLLQEAGFASVLDRTRGLDHGVWVPMMLMYSHADIPVVPLSVQPHLGAAHHFKIGRALTSLQKQGVLVFASGSFTHDLRRLRRNDIAAESPDDVMEFADWFNAALLEGRLADLLDYRTRAPNAVENHPTEEHLLPLYVALGAAGEGARAERLHTSSTYGVLRMDAYSFHA